MATTLCTALSGYIYCADNTIEYKFYRTYEYIHSNSGDIGHSIIHLCATVISIY